MTWEDYKRKIKETDSDARSIIEEAEIRSAIITALIRRRNALGLSQRELADLCGMPQSSVARIESNKAMPKLDTLVKLFSRLGLNFTIAPIEETEGTKKETEPVFT